MPRTRKWGGAWRCKTLIIKMKQMKKIIIVAAMLLTATAMEVCAQGQGVFMKRVPKVITGGMFTSSTIAGGSNTLSAVAEKDYSVFPLYTILDTVDNTGADTVYQQIKDYANQVYTWVHVNSISGTNTSCTVRLQVTGDAVTGAGYAGDWKTVKTYTVSATGNPYDHLVNSDLGVPGWHGTNIRWIFTGVGTQSSSWYAGLIVK